MPEYRRSHAGGGVYLFTVVTYNRLPILTTKEGRDILRSAWKDVKNRLPFATTAVCLLPDHIHCIWSLPEGDVDYSVRWKEIKRLFTEKYLMQVGPGGQLNESRLKRERGSRMAAPILGAYDKRPARSQPAYRLHSLQSGETWVSRKSS